MKQVLNSMIYDLEFLDSLWPTIEFSRLTPPTSNSWLNISNMDSDRIRVARLINNNDFENKSIINSEEDVEYDDYTELAYISWYTPEFDSHTNKSALIQNLIVKTFLENIDLGYWIGGAVKTYLASEEEPLLAPPPIDYRIEPIDSMTRKWIMNYQDDFAKFLGEDGKPYTYSEWNMIHGQETIS